VLCFRGRVAGDSLLSGRSERAWTFVGREKFWRLLELELACGWAYRGLGGGGVGAFCRGIALPIADVVEVEGLGLLIDRDVSSSSEEDSTLRRPGRDVVDCATIGEKLPGALDCGCGVPVDCDMVAGL
jgi:hypothetical protein